MSSFPRSFDKLLAHLQKKTALSSVNELLAWDQETFMPPAAASYRSEQIVLLSSLLHKASSSNSYKKILETHIDLESGQVLQVTDPRFIACLKELRRDYLQAVKLPTKFVAAYSEVTSQAFHTWAKARATNSFKTFSPLLKKLVELNQKKADYLGYQEHPYDAMLNLYEPAMSVAKLDPLFEELTREQSALILQMPQTDNSLLKGYFPKEGQLKLANELLQLVSIEPSRCRLDQSLHPFCLGVHPTDVRMTTHIDESYALSSISSVLHEAGHGLYESNLPLEYVGTPLSQACSLSIHESQSRFFECFIGQSKPFWSYFYPRFCAAFPHYREAPLENFLKAIHAPKRSLIRIESDEASYNLHVAVRYACEKKFLDGSLKVEELPEFWNSLMQQYLKLTPQSDANGCLQDVHWSHGYMGYFPTYTLGNLAAAALFTTLKKEVPSWSSEVAEGRLKVVAQFLHEKIHRHGRRYNSEFLLKQATGESFQTKDYLNHLRGKYLC